MDKWQTMVKENFRSSTKSKISKKLKGGQTKKDGQS